MFCRIFALSLFLPVVAPLGAANPPLPAETFRIGGTVVSAADGQPLPRTDVAIRPAEAQEATQHVMTGGDGRFVFTDVAPGKYGLTAQKYGFREQAYNQHEFFSTAIAVGRGQPSENIVFRLSPDAAISGIVVDEQQEPVRGASVLLFRDTVENGRHSIRQSDQNQSDDAGRYHFAHLEAGKYFVVVSAQPWYAQRPENGGYRTTVTAISGDVMTSVSSLSGSGSAQRYDPALDVAYPLTYYSGATDAADATPITLHPGDHFTADVTVTPVPALHLRVRIPSGDASQPANADFRQLVFDKREVNVSSSSAQLNPGVLDISGLAPGRYAMHVHAFTGNAWTDRSQLLDVTSDAEIDASHLSPSSVSLQGTIVNDNGSPAPQAFIRFANPETGDHFNAQASDKGEFDVQHDLPAPGSYLVQVFNVPGAMLRDLAGAGARIEGQSLQLQGNTSVRLKVTISTGVSRVDGMVSCEDKPVPGAMVVLVPQDPVHNLTLFRRDQSDSDGTFTLRSVLPGKYTVVAIENGWDLEWTDPAVLKPFLDQGQTVAATLGARPRVTVCLQSAARPGCETSSASK